MIHTIKTACWLILACAYLAVCMVAEQRHHARHNDAEGT